MKKWPSFIFVLATCLAGLFVFFGIPRILMIKSIACSDQYGPCNPQLTDQARVSEGKNLSEVRKNIARQMSKNLVVASYSTQLVLPNSYLVRIVIRKPAFAVKRVGSQSFFEVTKDGLVIRETNATSLPTLFEMGGPLAPGDRLPDSDIFASSILSDFFYMFGTAKGDVDNSLAVVAPNGVKIIFPLAGDHDLLVGEANFILSRLNNAGQDSKIVVDYKLGKVREIDLRFKNPVVR